MDRLGSVSVGGSSPVRIMGIINASPESFYKKSVHTSQREISRIAKKMEEDGADFIDVGGMSTAPYLRTLVPEKTEIERITEAIRAVRKACSLPISIDTCRPAAARAAFDLGVEILNDITGLQHDESMSDLLKEYRPSVILCAYGSGARSGGAGETKKFLHRSIGMAIRAGIHKNRITVDPAIGFFRKEASGVFYTKIYSDWCSRDITTIKNLKSINLGRPLLVSISRKSFIGRILNQSDPEKRLAGSLAAETIAVLNGADIIRTHNVRETSDAVQVAQQLGKFRKGL